MTVLPVVRRHLVEPMLGYLTAARLRAAWRELEASQWMSRQALEERQWRRFKALLDHAYAENDFYRRRFDAAGLAPGDIRDASDLPRIPILTKHEVRAEGTGLLSRGVVPETLMKAKTGGSTGKPLELCFTEEVSQLRNASGRRHKRWSGWEVGEPVGAVWGNPVRPDRLTARLREWLLSPVIYLDTMSVTPEAVHRFAREWARVRPTMIFGHAHSVFLLANLLRDLGIDEVRPRGVITSSMMLLPHERSAIEGVFGVAVTDMYGCEEVGLIASQCERHEGLHVNVDQLLVEVVRDDGTPAPPGDCGLVVVTDLLNRAMPFIRYKMEDTAETIAVGCSCGRGMPSLRRVTGRVADFLKRVDGSRVAGISLIENSLTRIPGFEQMQIVQEDLRRILLRVVPSPGASLDCRDELVKYFEATFPEATVVLDAVPGISAEPNGKYRFSICRVPD